MTVTRIQCPSCSATLKSGNALPAGRLVKCPKCGKSFTVPGEEAKAGPAPVPVAAIAPAKTATPRKPATVDDFDDDDEAPLQKPAKKPKKKKARVGLIVGIVGGALLVLVGFGVALAMVVSNYLSPDNKREPRQTHNPNQNGGNPAPVALEKGELDNWLQDVEEAKRQAASEKKDIFIFFDTSGLPDSTKLVSEVLAQNEFKESVPNKFVLMWVDFPQVPQGFAKVKDAARNNFLQRDYEVSTFPTIVLADAQGKPYGRLGYQEGEAKTFLASLGKVQANRAVRDGLLAKIEKSSGPAKLHAAKEALDFIQKEKALTFYLSFIDGWEKLAQEHDPKNELGLAEVFFEVQWVHQLAKVNRSNHDETAPFVHRLDEWRKKCRFKDPDRAAQIYLLASGLAQEAGKEEEALNYIEEALACQPTKKELRQQLTVAGAMLGLSSGTGFVVAPGGYILTNYHVAGGKGRIQVRIPHEKRSVAADIIAEDQPRDITLIRIKEADKFNLKAVIVAGKKQIHRGETVAALGFPLGDAVGSGVKFTTGVVSAVPEAGNDHMLILDAKVNPGNSGGPLCDSFGNIVGMVTAKSFAFGTVESYGMALPGQDLEAFLVKHLKGYKPQEPNSKKMPWDEVDRLLSPSVLMIVKKGKHEEDS